MAVSTPTKRAHPAVVPGAVTRRAWPYTASRVSTSPRSGCSEGSADEPPISGAAWWALGAFYTATSQNQRNDVSMVIETGGVGCACTSVRWQVTSLSGKTPLGRPSYLVGPEAAFPIDGALFATLARRDTGSLRRVCKRLLSESRSLSALLSLYFAPVVNCPNVNGLPSRAAITRRSNRLASIHRRLAR